jgi:hypothetical protein
MEDTHKFGDKNLKTALIFAGIGALAFQVFFWTVIYPQDRTEPNPSSIECKADSLQNVINNLQIDLETQSKEFDNRENKYQNTILEYEYGIEWIEKYHSEAYRDFHRVLAYKERYSRMDEIANKQRLQTID